MVTNTKAPSLAKEVEGLTAGLIPIESVERTNVIVVNLNQ